MKTRMIVAAIALAASGSAAADEWKYSVTPYVWATDVGIGVALRDRSLVDETIPFEDLLKDLESAAMLRAEATRGAHGMAIDLFDVTLADDTGRVAMPGSSGAEVALDAEIGLSLFDVEGIYDPRGDGQGFALLYGARIIEQREDVTAQLFAGDDLVASARKVADERYIDALVGLRYSGELGTRWGYELTADVSSGGTQMTWSASPSLYYRFGEQQQYRLTAGYRHLSVDYDTDPGIDSDMTMSGLLVGVRFDF
jgi:hypothetical protein